MGEVYRARDGRLDRIVAVKVLRAGMAGNSDLRSRFEREARAISHLSHPHICALYDIGNADGAEYLVMEYVEGETLADRLSRGPLPVSQVLRYGAQIAEALHHAHRGGIAHRDLKPGNVMLTNTGVKLLDFGLAKVIEQPVHVFSDDSAPATMKPLTAEGTIVGTFQYMSPEQLHGSTVDHRSDIFSLGVVLYEMTTGQRPFPASSYASLIAATLSADPVPLRSLQPLAPPALERIILTALEKDPDERWQTAHDVARQLRWLAESSPSMEISAVVDAPRRRMPRGGAIAAIAAITAALLTFAAMRFLRAAPVQHVTARLQFVTPDDIQPSVSPESPSFALSPDGRTLCFVGHQAGSRYLFLRPLDSLAVRRIEGTEDAFSPFWSPDGAWVAYSAGNKLWKIQVTGGAVPQAICEVGPAGAVGSWGGHTILFVDRPGGRPEIFRVTDSGGTAQQVTKRTPGEWRHGWPHVLADGVHFLYLDSTANGLDRQLVLASIDDAKSSVLLRNVSQTDLLSDGELVYVRDGKLLAQRFDASRGAVIGEPTLVANDVSYFYLSGRAQFSAANGVIVYQTDTSTGRLTISDRNGTARVLDDQGPFYDVAMSPDGKRAAVTLTSRATGMGDIWIYDLTRDVKDRFTSEPGFELAPLWASDGRSIVYSDAPGGSLPHLVRRSLGSTSSSDLLPRGPFQFAGSFSRDGGTLFFYGVGGPTKEDILKLDVATKVTTPLITASFNETEPQVSPDGQWLAFVSDASGKYEVYVVSLAAANAEPIRLSQAGGWNPRWRGDGSELFFLSDQRIVMSVVPATAGNWRDARTKDILHAPKDAASFAVTPDGQSFLILENARGVSDSSLHVVLFGS
jgi:Tol biopolymer transport system component